MPKFPALRKLVPGILFAANLLAALVLYWVTGELGASGADSLYYSMSMVFFLAILEGIFFYKPEKTMPVQWYKIIADRTQFKGKFIDIKNKSRTAYMVWCADYGDAKVLEPYFTSENSWLVSHEEAKLIRLINTERIAGREERGEELYNEHLKWMKDAIDKKRYECFRTNIGEYEVAIGVSREGGVEVMRACLIINDQYDPKFMIYFDGSKGEQAKGVVLALYKWFTRELELAKKPKPLSQN